MAAISHNPITTADHFPATHATAMDSTNKTTGGSTPSETSSASISANDFLTLLVTEMKNQDPTATTDPNEYINQLVNVNSLEQLIDINQTLTSAYGSSPAYTTSSVAAQTAARPQSAAPESQPAAHLGAPHPVTQTAASAASSTSSAGQTSSGNLGIPASTAAAERLAEALGGDLRQRQGSSAVR